MFTDFNTINREAFMLILADIWDKWASNEKLKNAARRVGVAPDMISVEFMQQDKFKRAEACIEKESCSSASSSVSGSLSSTSSPSTSLSSDSPTTASPNY